MSVVARTIGRSGSNRILASCQYVSYVWTRCGCRRLRGSSRAFCAAETRAAKRVTKKSLSELTQGQIKAEPLPPVSKADGRPESLMQAVRNLMIKFSDCVLLTKVGKFYELYYEHADVYAPKLNIRLTEKGKDGVSFAGFPHVQLDRYLKILVRDLGLRVAICQEFPEYIDGQIQTPIPRRVTRIVTPGTLIDEEFIDQAKNNFLLSVHQHGSLVEKSSEPTFGLSWMDISTGEFFIQATGRADLVSALLRIDVSEVIVTSSVEPGVQEEISKTLSIPIAKSDSSTTSETIPDHRAWIERLSEPLPANNDIADIEMVAIQNMFNYIDRHLLETSVKPLCPQRHEHTSTMLIDKSSIRGLELLKTTKTLGDKGSLLNSIKRTVTSGGTRLLRERLIYPSISPATIEYRLDLIDAFLANRSLHDGIVAHLKGLHDMHRIAQRFELGRGDAEDLLRLASTFGKIQDMLKLLRPYSGADNARARALHTLLSGLELDGPAEMCARIETSIDSAAVDVFLRQADGLSNDDADLEANLSSGVTLAPEVDAPRNQSQFGQPWVMKETASERLQKLHQEFNSLSSKWADMQTDLREKLSAPRLVLKVDNKYGHICHAPRTKGFNEEVFKDLGAQQLGHLKSVRAFYLPQWTTLGKHMKPVEFDIRREEQLVFESLRQLVIDNIQALRKNASIMDELDVTTAFATLAEQEQWTRPLISTSREHKIQGGRHPTVTMGLRERGLSFVENNLFLDQQAHTWLITGPNMAGKSTFLRQNALITILAQVGSYVPADFAEIGIVDKIFSRIGAADDLYRNESTFMVEMLETAAILKGATDRSFVIMDEVGRGTSPDDGTAVAYASLHHLYNTNKCRTLFATHFHSLADKTADWPQLAQHCTDLKVDGDSWNFDHKIRPGVNRESHALKVASFANVPTAMLEVAEAMLAQTKNNVA